MQVKGESYMNRSKTNTRTAEGPGGVGCACSSKRKRMPPTLLRGLAKVREEDQHKQAEETERTGPDFPARM